MRTAEQILESLNGAADRSALPVQLCRDCSEVLGLVGVTISLVDADGFHAVVGASGAVVGRLEELQFELGEGPSVDARDSGASLQSDLGTGAAGSWPVFTPRAMRAGIRCVRALPLQVGGVRLGGLGLYGSAAGRLGGDAVPEALAYADAATAVLLDLQARTADREGALHPQIDVPVRYRAQVHQATGFIAFESAVGVTEALLLLRARAYATDRAVVDVARDVLAGHLHISAGDGQDGDESRSDQ